MAWLSLLVPKTARPEQRHPQKRADRRARMDVRSRKAPARWHGSRYFMLQGSCQIEFDSEARPGYNGHMVPGVEVTR